MPRSANFLLLLLVGLLAAQGTSAQKEPAQKKAQQRGIRESVFAFLAPVFGESRDFAWHVQGFGSGSREVEPRLEIVFECEGEESFTLWVRSKAVTFLLRRAERQTELVLPKQKRRFLAKANLDKSHLDKSRSEEGIESLAPKGFLQRLLGQRTKVRGLLKYWLLGHLAAAKSSPEGELLLGEQIHLGKDKAGNLILKSRARRSFFEGIRELRFDAEVVSPPDFEGVTKEIDRVEMELMFFRALKRFLEIYVPPLAPRDRLPARKVAHGELRYVKGQRLVLLEGSPEEIGKAHGELLGPLIRRTLDSYIYLVGAVETLRTGKWFPGEMEKAWKQLSPHIPLRHRRELRALAAAVPGVSLREIRLANVLPEYFHCSGFAVFGKATKGGKLYHGRVLDYMTAIGLQQAGALFYIRPEDGHDFAHVGYAGFIGVVTGMNTAGISLGEMGGGGRYEWNGVPMASLMRQALEECDSLTEVQSLWRRSPRTCEYYYVFADAKGPSAVGVKATPRILEILKPGQDHDRLGKGITDVVLMSAGSRLQKLRVRIKESYGKIDLDKALHLMDRPVAMSSNLHNALMLPGSLEIYVAHAGKGKPAAERPYVRFDLGALGKSVDQWPASKSLRVKEDRRQQVGRDEASRRMLSEMLWDPRPFRLTIQENKGSSKGDALLRFPSPLPLGDVVNDQVVLEWYRPRGRRKSQGKRPAILCLHILGGNMELSRGIARTASYRGMHGFLLYMPGYGPRGGKHARRDIGTFLHRSRQAAADVQRAQDAIASLPGIDPSRIYLQGTSLGGIIGALSAGLADDFAGHFFMLAGGGLKDLLRKGKRDSRKMLGAFHRAGIRGTALDQILDAIDPAFLAYRLDPQKTWLYSAQNDTVIPADQARLLAREARLPASHHLWLAGDHYTAILSLPWALAHMFRQIESR